MVANTTLNTTAEHKIELNARKELKMTGVIEVIFATANEIFAKTECGNIKISGNNLKVKSVLIAEKILEAVGEITKIEYTSGKKSFMQKLFK
mgnify:CR=1 FL=1